MYSLCILTETVILCLFIVYLVRLLYVPTVYISKKVILCTFCVYELRQLFCLHSVYFYLDGYFMHMQQTFD